MIDFDFDFDFGFALKLRNYTPLFYMPQMNPKKFPHNTTFSVQLPYIAGHSL